MDEHSYQTVGKQSCISPQMSRQRTFPVHSLDNVVERRDGCYVWNYCINHTLGQQRSNQVIRLEPNARTVRVKLNPAV